jgi:hypothetical protein
VRLETQELGWPTSLLKTTRSKVHTISDVTLTVARALGAVCTYIALVIGIDSLTTHVGFLVREGWME